MQGGTQQGVESPRTSSSGGGDDFFSDMAPYNGQERGSLGSRASPNPALGGRAAAASGSTPRTPQRASGEGATPRTPGTPRTPSGEKAKLEKAVKRLRMLVAKCNDLRAQRDAAAKKCNAESKKRKELEAKVASLESMGSCESIRVDAAGAAAAADADAAVRLVVQRCSAGLSGAQATLVAQGASYAAAAAATGADATLHLLLVERERDASAESAAALAAAREAMREEIDREAATRTQQAQGQTKAKVAEWRARVAELEDTHASELLEMEGAAMRKLDELSRGRAARAVEQCERGFAEEEAARARAHAAALQKLEHKARREVWQAGSEQAEAVATVRAELEAAIDSSSGAALELQRCERTIAAAEAQHGALRAEVEAAAQSAAPLHAQIAELEEARARALDDTRAVVDADANAQSVLESGQLDKAHAELEAVVSQLAAAEREASRAAAACAATEARASDEAARADAAAERCAAVKAARAADADKLVAARAEAAAHAARADAASAERDGARSEAARLASQVDDVTAELARESAAALAHEEHARHVQERIDAHTAAGAAAEAAARDVVRADAAAEVEAETLRAELIAVGVELESAERANAELTEEGAAAAECAASGTRDAQRLSAAAAAASEAEEDVAREAERALEGAQELLTRARAELAEQHAAHVASVAQQAERAEEGAAAREAAHAARAHSAAEASDARFAGTVILCTVITFCANSSHNLTCSP